MAVIILDVVVLNANLNGVLFVKGHIEGVVVHLKEVPDVGLVVLHAIRKNWMIIVICSVIVQRKKEILSIAVAYLVISANLGTHVRLVMKVVIAQAATLLLQFIVNIQSENRTIRARRGV